MRLDKYLKISRLIKRRTVANEACDAGKILVNDKVARASYDVKAGDVIEIQMGQKALKVRVEQVAEVVRKEDAAGLLRRLGEEAGGPARRDIRNELGLPDALAGAAVGTQQGDLAPRQRLSAFLVIVFINKSQTFGKFVSTFDFLFFRKRHRRDSRWCKTFILCKQVSAFCNHIFSYTSIKKQGISTFFVPQAYLGKLLFIQPRNLHKMHEVFTGILVQ